MVFLGVTLAMMKNFWVDNAGRRWLTLVSNPRWMMPQWSRARRSGGVARAMMDRHCSINRWGYKNSALCLQDMGLEAAPHEEYKKIIRIGPRRPSTKGRNTKDFELRSGQNICTVATCQYEAQYELLRSMHTDTKHSCPASGKIWIAARSYSMLLPRRMVRRYDSRGFWKLQPGLQGHDIAKMVCQMVHIGWKRSI